MLKQRVMTAVVLLPAVVAIVLFAPLWLFDAVVALALIMLAVEYAALCGLSRVWRVVLPAATVLLFGGAAGPWETGAAISRILLLAAVALWLLAPLWLATRSVFPAAIKLPLGLLLLAGAGIALHGLKLIEADGRWVLAALVIVWAADIGAYAAGRTLGRHKLAPSISPGKTWEGMAGGVLLVLAAGLCAAPWLVQETRWAGWMLLLLAVTVISVIGDLVESLLKRQAGVKDSGRLLPGHGGVLDRLDSLLAVAPVFLLAGLKLGIFGELSLFGR